ncbi:MAG TPA: type II CAAX endopeptidase family protein [Acidimicrobiales bacterium]
MTPAKRKGSRVTPKKHTPAKPSPTSTSKRTKGRVPVAEPGSKSARRAGREPDPAPVPESESSVPWWKALITPRPAPTRSDTEVVEKAEVLGADDQPVAKRAFTGWRVALVFLGAQVAGMIAFGIAQGATDYDFQIPPGTGAAVGQAVGQAATGQAIDIAVSPPIWLTMLMQLPLWAVLGGVPVYLAITRGKGVVAELGLRMKAIDVPVGLAVGAACQLVMVPALYWLVFKAIGVKDVSAEARELTDRATDPLSILLVFVIVIVGAPVAEELFFRGMAQRTFLHKLQPRWAILASAAFFAMSHFQPLQFPALLVFGLILGYMAWKAERLGPAIWAHVGFNLVTAVGLIFHVGWW